MSKIDLVKFLANLIFKKEIKKQKGILKISPGDKVKAEEKAKFTIRKLEENANINVNNLTKGDLELLAESIANPFKYGEKTVVKSADILPFRFKRSFAEELADAGKKGDFTRMQGIMKLDPKFKEVMKNFKKQKMTEKLIRERDLQTKRIPLDTMKYDTPEIAKLKGAERMNYLITSPEQTAKLLKKGVTSDDIIYAQDRYGMTAKDMIDAVDAGFKFPFADGGIAGMLGERTGYESGRRAGPAGGGLKRKASPTDWYTDKIIADNLGRIKSEMFSKYVLPERNKRFFESITDKDLYHTYDEDSGYSGFVRGDFITKDGKRIEFPAPADKDISVRGLLEFLDKHDEGYDYNIEDMRPFDKRFYWDEDKGFVRGVELKGGGIAGMLGEPTYQDEDHRVPLKGGKIVKGLAELMEQFFPGTTKIGKRSKPFPEKVQEKMDLRKAITEFQEREAAAKSKITSPAGEGKFTKAEVLNQMFENTIKQSKSAKDKKMFTNFAKEIQGNPELAKDPKVWNFFTGKLPKNQKLVVYADDTVDFFRQTEFGPHNIEGVTKFHEKHPFLTRKEAVKISKMEPNDQVMELKRLETIRRTTNATGGRVPMWLGGGLTAGKRTLAELLKYLSKGSSHGKTPSEMLQMINPKQFNEMLNRPEGIPSIAKEMIEKYTKEMKIDRAGMVEHLIGTGRRIKQADNRITSYVNEVKERFMKELNMSEEAAEKAAYKMATMLEQQLGKKVGPKITDQGLLEMENIGKNLATKDRKLNATGGRVPRSGGGIMKIIKTFFQKKPETLKEFIEKRKFLEKIMGKTKEAELQKMLEEQKILQKQLEKNPPFKFPDTGPHSDISKEIEVILNKKTTKHADGGVAGMLGE